MFDRVWDALRGQIDVNNQVRHALKEVDDLSRDVHDHENRLLRLEIMVELARGDAGLRRLPSE